MIRIEDNREQPTPLDIREWTPGQRDMFLSHLLPDSDVSDIAAVIALHVEESVNDWIQAEAERLLPMVRDRVELEAQSARVERMGKAHSLADELDQLIPRIAVKSPYFRTIRIPRDRETVESH